MAINQQPQQPQQMQPEQEQGGQFANTPMDELVAGIHEAMVQLLKNVEGKASPGQQQQIAQALQSYRSAIASLGGEQQAPPEGGNTTLEQGGSGETVPV